MKKIALHAAGYAASFVIVAIVIELLLWIVAGVVVGAAALWLAYQFGRLHQRVLRWWDDRTHQAFIDDCIRTARRKAPASASIDIQ